MINGHTGKIHENEILTGDFEAVVNIKSNIYCIFVFVFKKGAINKWRQKLSKVCFGQ